MVLSKLMRGDKMNRIYIQDDNLIIETPLHIEESDCYHPYNTPIARDNIIGVIEGNNIGFCYKIDMSYCGKMPQYSDFFYKFFGTVRQFRRLCKKLNIEIMDV
jgi:hypothetical protein